MITSNRALKSSESKLFNTGSTIKIGYFLGDIKSSEIKVPNPEISEILEFAFSTHPVLNSLDSGVFKTLCVVTVPS